MPVHLGFCNFDLKISNYPISKFPHHRISDLSSRDLSKYATDHDLRKSLLPITRCIQQIRRGSTSASELLQTKRCRQLRNKRSRFIRGVVGSSGGSDRESRRFACCSSAWLERRSFFNTLKRSSCPSSLRCSSSTRWIPSFAGCAGGEFRELSAACCSS